MSTSRIAVFLGPSCPEFDARQHLPEATYFGPAARGSIYSIINDGYDVIVLIDGLFYATLAVWHKEIMFALSSGIEVIGASSMGALRAAELQGTGIIGVGKIFEWYRDGLIDGDDEVAMLHEGCDESYAALTIPLVNLRWQLREAVKQSVITRGQEEQIIASAKDLCFTDRILPRILLSLRDELDCTKLIEWHERSGEDLKKSDAIAALNYARDIRPRAAGPVGIEFEQIHINVGIEYFSTERMTSIQAKSTAGGTSLATHRQYSQAEVPQFVDFLKARAYERLIVGWGRELRIEPERDVTGEAIGWSAEVINFEHRLATGLTLVDIAREHADTVFCRSLKKRFCCTADSRQLIELNRAVQQEVDSESLAWRRLAVLDGRLIYTLHALGKQKGVVAGLLASREDEAQDSVEQIMRFAVAVDEAGPPVFGYAFDPAREILLLRQYLHRLETYEEICP